MGVSSSSSSKGSSKTSFNRSLPSLFSKKKNRKIYSCSMVFGSNEDEKTPLDEADRVASYSPYERNPSSTGFRRRLGVTVDSNGPVNKKSGIPTRIGTIPKKPVAKISQQTTTQAEEKDKNLNLMPRDSNGNKQNVGIKSKLRPPKIFSSNKNQANNRAVIVKPVSRPVVRTFLPEPSPTVSREEINENSRDNSTHVTQEEENAARESNYYIPTQTEARVAPTAEPECWDDIGEEEEKVVQDEFATEKFKLRRSASISSVRSEGIEEQEIEFPEVLTDKSSESSVSLKTKDGEKKKNSSNSQMSDNGEGSDFLIDDEYADQPGLTFMKKDNVDVDIDIETSSLEDASEIHDGCEPDYPVEQTFLADGSICSSDLMLDFEHNLKALSSASGLDLDTSIDATVRTMGIDAFSPSVDNLIESSTLSLPSRLKQKSVSGGDITRTYTFRPPKLEGVLIDEDAGTVTMSWENYQSLTRELIEVKTNLHKLKRTLLESEVANPFDSIIKANDKLTEEKDTDLKTHVIYLQQEIKTKNDTIELLQNQMQKYLNLKNDSGHTADTINAATQTIKDVKKFIPNQDSDDAAKSTGSSVLSKRGLRY